MQSHIVKTPEEIASRIDELAGKIAEDYTGKELVLLGVLTGAYVFLADLSRALWRAGQKTHEIDFIGVSSYGADKTSSRKPRLTKDMSISLRGKDVLVVEDMLETGWSVDFIKKSLVRHAPKSIKTVVLLQKPGKNETNTVPEYVGFFIDDNIWVEGYGLDTANKNRGCPEIVSR